MEKADEKTASRIEDIEVRMAFLEKSINDLDQVIQELAVQLDQTRNTVRQLREQVQSDTLTIRGDPLDEVPPHY